MKYALLVLGLLMSCPKNSMAQNKDVSTASHTTPDYVMLKQGFWGSWKVIHVARPNKKLHKWYYDSKTDTYYRMKTWIGLCCRIK